MAELRAPVRRAGGATRKRLLEATSDLLAAQGEARVSLRDITDAAQANVAAVSYHFGSKENLCRAAIDCAIEEVAATHLRRLERLPAEADVGQIAGALVATIAQRLTSRDQRERVMLKLSAQSILADAEATRYVAAAGRVFDLLAHKLGVALPTLAASELRLRAQAAATLLHVVAAGALGNELGNRSATELTKRLVPIVAGSLAGWPPAGTRRV